MNGAQDSRLSFVYIPGFMMYALLFFFITMLSLWLAPAELYDVFAKLRLSARMTYHHNTMRCLRLHDDGSFSSLTRAL